MAATDNIAIRVRVLNPQRQPLTGVVDIEFKPQAAGLPPVTIRAADASKDIDVTGLERAPAGVYQMTVTSGEGTNPVSQSVTIPTTGFNTVEVILDQPAPIKVASIAVAPVVPTPVLPTDPVWIVILPDKYTLQGTLTFDTGFPAARITTRVYSVVFGGNDVKLQETKKNG